LVTSPFEGEAFGVGSNPGSSGGSSLAVDIKKDNLIAAFEEAFGDRRSDTRACTGD
jgi:hypothetical protein